MTRTTPDSERERRERFVNSRHQSMGSVGPFRLLVNGHYRPFEFHGVCGPVIVDAAGEPAKRQPGSSSDFWPAFDAWRKAGCHVDRFGIAFIPSLRILES